MNGKRAKQLRLAAQLISKSIPDKEGKTKRSSGDIYKTLKKSYKPNGSSTKQS